MHLEEVVVRIVAVTHVPFEGPGTIADWAHARGHRLEVYRAYERDSAHPGEHEMLVVMGGPMGVQDEDAHAWLAPEKRFVAAAIESGAYVLGVCLGAQIVAEVLGAIVERGPHKEIGWFPVRLTEAGRTSSVFGRLPEEFEVLHWHGDIFEIPDGATRTVESDAFSNQAFEYDDGRVVALQFHLEETAKTLETLIEAGGHEIEAGGRWVQSAEDMMRRPERFTDSRRLLSTLLDSMTLGR